MNRGSLNLRLHEGVPPALASVRTPRTVGGKLPGVSATPDPTDWFHVRLEKGFLRQAHEFNLGEAEVIERFVRPWRHGRRVAIGERAFLPAEARLTIYSGQRLTTDQLSMGRGWSSAIKAGEDVTARLLKSDPILLLTGPPGAGKTTVADSLTSRYERAVHLESDLFFHFIARGFIEPWKPESHEQNVTVMRIVADAAASYAAAGYFTIVDGIFLPGWFFERLRDALVERGNAVAYVVLRAPLALCETRATERERDPLKDEGAIKQLWDAFADLGELEHHAVNTDDADPAHIAAWIAGNLQSLLASPSPA